MLECYSDPKAAQFFNSDNCTSDFVYNSVDEVAECIDFWIEEYKRGYYVRFSVLSKIENKAIGTIEMFSKEKNYGRSGIVGVLRLDLASPFETQNTLKSILRIVEDNFYRDFVVDSIVTKSIPLAVTRNKVLVESGYKKLDQGEIVSYPHYFIRRQV